MKSISQRLPSYLLLFIGCTAFSAVAQTAIPGKFEVSSVGAATYTIPIQVPPGVAEMAPQLSLVYNSRSGNGLLGVGWTLAGLSTITRCPRTTPQDGAKGGVSYNTLDRFCLDGRRLMVVSGNYGAPGSSYRTEIDSFTQITAYGTSGSGPLYFVAKTRDGKTLEFGKTTDSRAPVAALETVKYWGLSSISDAVGNTQKIYYSRRAGILADDADFNIYPEKIEYTSNPTNSLAARSSVSFSYELRPDILNGYQGGHPFRISVRLASIKTTSDGQPALVYTPKYALGEGGRSAIVSLSMCGSDGLCAVETQFNLGGVGGTLKPVPGKFITAVETLEDTSLPGVWLPVDVNSDGFTDLIHLTEQDSIYRIWYSSGDGKFSVANHTAVGDGSFGKNPWRVLDVNGDGRADLVHLRDTLRVWLSRGDGTFSIASLSDPADGNLINGTWEVMDVDGDGLADLMHLRNDAASRWWRSNGDGTFQVATVPNSVDTDMGDAGIFLVLDTNGDGLADILHVTSRDDSSRVWVWTSLGNGAFDIKKFTNSVDVGYIGSGIWKQIDLNGDGLIDLVHMKNVWGGARAWISRGNGTFLVSEINSTSDVNVIDGAWQAVDLNGDGLEDLLHTPSNLASGRYWTWYSKGDGTFDVKENTGATVDGCSSTTACEWTLPGDYLGAGVAGFVRYDRKSVRSAWFLGQQPRNIVTSIADGLGGYTAWELSPLPAMERRQSYVKDIPSDKNVWTLTTPMSVVERADYRVVGWVDDYEERSLNRTVSYRYGSARTERNGRGFVGFSWMQSTDFSSGLTSRRYFRQDFPYLGLLSKQGTGRGGSWNNLSLSEITHGCLRPPESDACTIAAGNLYFPYPEQQMEQRWDLNGAPYPRKRITNSNVDRYGNIGRTRVDILNPDGTPTDYITTTVNTYVNDPQNWRLGLLVKSVVTRQGPALPAAVLPGTGGLPDAAPPSLPQPALAALTAVLQFLLTDD